MSARAYGAFIALGFLPIMLSHGWASAQVLFESARLVSSDASSGAEFGQSVSMSGDWAIVGSFRTEAAYVYRKSGSIWIEEQKLTPPGAGSEGFGFSVCLSGNLAVVGAPFHDENGALSGAAYVFRWDGYTWVFEQELLPDDGAGGDQFARSVAIDRAVVVAGAGGDDDNGFSAGAAYVFRWNGTGWAQEQKLLAEDGDEGDAFGDTVSLSGSTILIGAVYDGDNGHQAGSAYAFRWNGSTWAQEQKLLPADGTPSDNFGFSVSVSGDIALIGAPADGGVAYLAGSAYIFRRSGPFWAQEQKLLAPEGQKLDLFGVAVAASDDVVLVGAFHETAGAFIYEWGGVNWVYQRQLQTSDEALHFGSSTSISVGRALVGAPGNPSRGDTGAAYVFDHVACDLGYYGPACENECPGGADNPCNGHGTCDDDLDGTGECACNAGFTGMACESCAAGFYGSSCLECPGEASNPCGGNGVCDDGAGGSGQCQCNPGYGGVACEDCAPGYFGATCQECPGGAANPCSGHGVCDQGLAGSGVCMCEPGYAGTDCFLQAIPTVSAWGLLILGLMVLCGAKVASHPVVGSD